MAENVALPAAGAVSAPQIPLLYLRGRLEKGRKGVGKEREERDGRKHACRLASERPVEKTASNRFLLVNWRPAELLLNGTQQATADAALVWAAAAIHQRAKRLGGTAPCRQRRNLPRDQVITPPRNVSPGYYFTVIIYHVENLLMIFLGLGISLVSFLIDVKS